MLDNWDLCFMIYMFLSNNPSSGDINSSNLSCSNYAPGAKNGPPFAAICFTQAYMRVWMGKGSGIHYSLNI